MSATADPLFAPGADAHSRKLRNWWPLAVLIVLAAALRLGTLGLQSFWFDEAFTPLHVFHSSLFSTLRQVTKTENSPPLWYILTWIDYRVLGSGEWSLRLPSALAGIALVPVAWGIGRELAGRAAATAAAAIIAVDPIFVWYSQEARVYSLYALASGVLMLCFLRVVNRPQDRGRMIAFAVAGAAALVTHYFTAFLLAGMAAWLLWRPETRRRCIPALVAIGLVGLALLPLLAGQGGRNTNWIGVWPLRERLETIPRYFLLGNNAASLGHAIELLVALPLLGACAVGAWRVLDLRFGRGASRGQSLAAASPGTEELSFGRGAAISLWLAACGIGIPLLLALAGADYLAPRNVLGAMVPVAALIAVLASWPRAGRLTAVALALGILGLLAVTIDTDLSPRLQRGDWRDLAHAIPAGGAGRAYTSLLLGSAPLQHYIPGLRRLRPHEAVAVREIVETGEKPLRASAGRPPPGFHLLERSEANGLVAFRFVAPTARRLSEEQLRRDVLDRAEPWVLVPGSARTSR